MKTFAAQHPRCGIARGCRRSLARSFAGADRARRIRYLLAWNHGLTRAGVFMQGVLGWLRRRARVRQGIPDGRGGGVVIVQRFGPALNVNVHTHALVLDGVFAEGGPQPWGYS